MPICTVQICRTPIRATPAIRLAPTLQAPKLAKWNSTAMAWMPRTSQGNRQMMPIRLAITRTAFESKRMPSMSHWVRRSKRLPQTQARSAIRYMAVTPSSE